MDALTGHVPGDALFSLANTGVVLAVILILTATLLLPRDERWRARGPLWLLVGHLALAVPRSLATLPHDVDRIVGLAALLLLLLSLGHGSTLVLLEALLSRRLGKTPPRIFRDIVSGLVYIAACLLTLHAAGVDTSSLLTTSALLTAIIGLSLQDTLGNLFAGLSLQGEHPFGVGDWIEYDEGSDHVGCVMEINWRATKVRTLEQVELTIPNGRLARASILNYSRPTPVVRRSMRVVLPRTQPTHAMRQVILAAIREAPGVLQRPAPSVLTESFEEDGVRYWGRYFIDDFARRFVVAGDVHDRVWYALAREGVSPAASPHEVFVHATGEDVDARSAAVARARNLEALHRVELLQDLEERHLETLAEGSKAICYSDGEVIIRQGDPGESLYVCLKGRLEVEFAPEVGRARIVATLGPGGVVGELSAMTGEPRTATVRAVGHSELLRLDKPAFQRVLADSPTLAEALSARLASRRAELDSLQPAKERIEAPAAERDPEALLERIRAFFGIS